MEKSDFRKTKFDNMTEFLSMCRDYWYAYIKKLASGYHDPSLDIYLLKSLIEYYKITRKENTYLSFIMRNYQEINNLEKLYSILDDMDELNEKTYLFYQSILEECESFIQSNVPFKPSCVRGFETLNETEKYEAELLGLLLTEKDLDKYYQKEEAYYYLKERTKVWNCSAKEGIGYFGLFTEDDGDIIKEIKLCVPKIIDLETMLINVHEFKHGISLYPYIGSSKLDFDFEKEAKLEEKHFVSKYLLKK